MVYTFVLSLVGRASTDLGEDEGDEDNDVIKEGISKSAEYANGLMRSREELKKIRGKR